MDCRPPGSSVHEISQARILKWVAISFSRGSSWLRDWTHVSCIAGGFFTTEPPGKPPTHTHTHTHTHPHTHLEYLGGWTWKIYVCVCICLCVYTHLCLWERTRHKIHWEHKRGSLPPIWGFTEYFLQMTPINIEAFNLDFPKRIHGL